MKPLRLVAVTVSQMVTQKDPLKELLTELLWVKLMGPATACWMEPETRLGQQNQKLLASEKDFEMVAAKA